jgi:hypothetical protein
MENYRPYLPAITTLVGAVLVSVGLFFGLDLGVAGAVAQALIGHDSEAIHEHYINVGRDALQKAAAVFPSI